MSNTYKFNKEKMINNLIIIILIVHIISKYNKKIIIQNKISYISLKIIGPGYKKIFYEKDQTCTSFSPPNEVYINDKNISIISSSYMFNESVNDVKLIWNEKELFMNCLFYKCKDINEIDFSHFESIGTEIIHMFDGCTSLTSINLSNFNTSKVTNFDYLFNNCENLNSIDLSSFDTLNITSIRYMFTRCISLNNINLSNFNTPKLSTTSHTFDSCINLTSVDLSNFDLSEIGIMDFFFFKLYFIKNCQISYF